MADDGKGVVTTATRLLLQNTVIPPRVSLMRVSPWLWFSSSSAEGIYDGAVLQQEDVSAKGSMALVRPES